jgi:branched-chain amino acid transport system substrate-binding protein
MPTGNSESMQGVGNMKRVLSTGRIPALAVAALCAATAAVAQESIKIGIPMELSDVYGASGKRGAELAAEIYCDKVAGKNIELPVRDIQSESQATISVFNELINKGVQRQRSCRA